MTGFLDEIFLVNTSVSFNRLRNKNFWFVIGWQSTADLHQIFRWHQSPPAPFSQEKWEAEKKFNDIQFQTSMGTHLSLAIDPDHIQCNRCTEDYAHDVQSYTPVTGATHTQITTLTCINSFPPHSSTHECIFSFVRLRPPLAVTNWMHKL